MGTFAYQGRECDLDCDNCDECIHEQKNDNLTMRKIDLENIKTCNDCPQSQCKESGGWGTSLCNWYCNTDKLKRIIDMNVLSTKSLDIPKWCPLGLHKQVSVQEKPKKKPLTYAEKREMWEDIPFLCKWEDIKISEIYHVPPVLGEKRKDVLITNISDFSFQYRLIDKTNNSTSQATYTLYKSAIWWKFMVKHKIIKMKPSNPK